MIDAVGALTGVATTPQANGFMGAFMEFAGVDRVILQGSSESWVYIYMHDGVAELRDANHLPGLPIQPRPHTHHSRRAIRRVPG